MKILRILLLVCICGCIDRPKVTTGLEGKLLPSFELLLSDSVTHFNTSDIPLGKPIVLFFFGAYCPYSRAQMEDIVTNMKELTNIQFYIFTNSTLSAMIGFSNNYQLQKYPNILTGLDYSDYFDKYFKTPGVPYLAIYTSQKRLRQVLIGKSSISDIKEIALK